MGESEHQQHCTVSALQIFSNHTQGDMGTMQELQVTLMKKEDQILHLQVQLQKRDDEIQQLRSQLDKFKSVFPFGQNPMTGFPMRNSFIRERRKHRAQGISAEPQDLQTLLELGQQKFSEYPKSDRSVVSSYSFFYFLGLQGSL